VTDFDVQVNDLSIALDTTQQSYTATLKVFFLAAKAQLAELTFKSSLPVGGQNGYEVTAVTDPNGAPLTFEQDEEQGTLTITLSSALNVGDGQLVTIEYKGSFNPLKDPEHYLPTPDTTESEAWDLYDLREQCYQGLAYRPNPAGKRVVMTTNWPDELRNWMPMHDTLDRTRGIMRITGPADSELLSNGTLISDTTKGTAREQVYFLPRDIEPQGHFIAAGELSRIDLGKVDNVTIQAYIYPENQTVPKAHAWDRAGAAMSYFNDWLGPYQFGHYSMVTGPMLTAAVSGEGSYAGFGNATMVSLNDQTLTEDSASTVLHELGHHWFGIVAYEKSFQDWWLTESLTQYLEAEFEGDQAGSSQPIHDRIESWRETVLAAPSYFDDDSLYYQSGGQPGDNSTASLYAPYYKGPLVLYMLQQELGQETFRKLVKELYQQHIDVQYDTATFVTMVNIAAGKDLASFFQEWVHGRGWPEIEVTWSYDAIQQSLTVSGTQVQDSTKFGNYSLEGNLALPLVLDDGDASTPECVVQLSFAKGKTSANSTVTCSVAPTEVAIAAGSPILAAVQAAK
jgi:aminopeptidase N